MKKLFTSESVTEGHPDKMCDQISDAILDELLRNDPNSRVACETAVCTGLILVMGEISTNCYVDIPKIARDTVREIGYTRAKFGFDADTCAVLTSLNEQSCDIALGVNKSIEEKIGEKNGDLTIGAGDQGIMFGFACNETDEYMPMPIALAHRLSKKLSEVRKDGTLSYLRPDGKTQVTIEYEDNKPIRVDTVVISSQHDPEITHEKIEQDIIEYVIKPVIPSHLIDNNIKYLINPTGRFVIGGPNGDSGLTGRKIIVDTYGGFGRHGGGAFSGKDPTKVDRSAAYAARWVAKNLVASGVADKLEIQLAYAIGVAKPVSISVDTFNTGKIQNEKIIDIIDKVFKLTPASIIKNLNLRSPIYRKTASYGHFGRNEPEFAWEKLDKIQDIRKLL